MTSPLLMFYERAGQINVFVLSLVFQELEGKSVAPGLIDYYRGVLRTLPKSKMEHFAKIVNCRKLILQKAPS